MENSNLIPIIVNKLLKEEIDTINTWYHGTRSLLPFISFSREMDGTGIVSSGKKYGGFFFTSNINNAEFYTEWFICKVTINNLVDFPNSSHPPTVLKQAIINKNNYIIKDTLDGSMYSNIAVVPHSNLIDVIIQDWIFVGDKEYYFNALDEMFGGDEEDDGIIYVTQWIINSFFNMTGGGLDYVLTIPIFKEYYDTKFEG